MKNYILWYRNVLMIRNNTYYDTVIYDHFLHINSTSVKEKTGGRRTFSVSFFVLNDCNGILHHIEGHKAPTIARLHREDGVKVSHVRISKFLAKFEETGSIGWIEDRIWQVVENNSRNEQSS